jgi:hypothetical protein
MPLFFSFTHALFSPNLLFSPLIRSGNGIIEIVPSYGPKNIDMTAAVC